MKVKKLNVYLRGFFYSNLGDDLFIHILAKRYPNIHFTAVINNEHADSLSSNRNIKLVRLRKSIRGVNRLISKIFPRANIYRITESRTDISVIIGGSLFQEYENDPQALERLRLLPKGINPVYILGANFGPYTTGEYLDASIDYFRKVTDICFRDRASYHLFSHLKTVRYAPDIVLGIESIAKGGDKKEKVCIISVMDFTGKKHLAPYQKSYGKFIHKAVNYYNAHHYKVILASFCKMEGDEVAIERVLEFDPLLKSKVGVLKYDGSNWKEAVHLISTASVVIATRFHSMVLGVVFGAQTLPIIYNDKCQHFLEDIESSDCGICLSDLDTYNLEEATYIELERVSELKEKSQEQFAELDKLLLCEDKYV